MLHDATPGLGLLLSAMFAKSGKLQTSGKTKKMPHPRLNSCNRLSNDLDPDQPRFLVSNLGQAVCTRQGPTSENGISQGG